MPLPPGYTPPAHNKIVPSTCAHCLGDVNILLAGWAADGSPQENLWTCPRCQAENRIVVPGKRVGIAYATIETRSIPVDDSVARRTPGWLKPALQYEAFQFRAWRLIGYAIVAILVLYLIVKLL